MTSYLTLSDITLALQNAQRTEELWQTTLKALHQRGVTMASYHHAIPRLDGVGTRKLQVSADGFPDDWVCHYIKRKLYKVDPIPALSKLQNTPFKWSNVEKLTTLASEQADYLNQMHAADFGDGLAMHVYGPNMRNAYVGMGFGREISDIGPAEAFELQCIAQLGHIRFCELTSDRFANDRELSPRERQILEWIARGKSNSVIAQILDVSPHTIDTLVRRLFDKLAVSDRTSAAIQGIGSGLVNLDSVTGM